MLRAVSANLGRRVVAADWARRTLGLTGDESVDLMFLQEVPIEDWEGICEKAGFGITADPEPRYQVRSLLLWRRGPVPPDPFLLPPAGYHGSSLAAARLDLPVLGETTAVSVHASPRVVEAQYREHWLQTGLPLPEP